MANVVDDIANCIYLTEEERDKWFKRPNEYLIEQPGFQKAFIEQMYLNHPDLSRHQLETLEKDNATTETKK
jgi:hypothetical protein